MKVSSTECSDCHEFEHIVGSIPGSGRPTLSHRCAFFYKSLDISYILIQLTVPNVLNLHIVILI